MSGQAASTSLVDAVFAAGVVGCGGAGFPTHVKYGGSAQWFIVNAAECEPLLRTDRHVMLRHPRELVETTAVIADQLGASAAVIALKKTYAKEIAALEEAIQALSSRVVLHKLENFYPAGDEQMIVQRVTGKSVPPAGLPLDVGAVVSNAATVLAVYDALRGTPLTHKYLTVIGDGVRTLVLRAPVGTPLTDCLKRCGWRGGSGHRVVVGGPLMGRLLEPGGEEAVSVTKTTSGLIVVREDSPLVAFADADIRHTVNRARSACIQCSQCTMLCPRNLLGHPLQPHRIMRKLAYTGSIEAILDDPEARQAMICCECGVCELYACPMQLQPRRVNVLIKRALAGRGERYKRTEDECRARPELDIRLIPGKRMAARAGVLSLYDREPEQCVDVVPERLVIPLRQHVGVPAEAVVRVGDAVTAGQLIARCPEGKLGANIHCGVAGRVAGVDENIVVDVERM